jgi:hypothetical protein
VVGQCDAVWNLYTKVEVLRDRIRILSNYFRFRQNNLVTRKKGPEPLIEPNTVVVLTVLFEIVEWLLFWIDEPLPGIVLPAAGSYVELLEHRDILSHLRGYSRLLLGIHIIIKVA